MSDTPLGSVVTADRLEALELALSEMTIDRDYWKERATTDWDRRSLRPEVTRVEPEAGEIAHKLAQAENLLSRIAQANVIFPSMCSNNMEAWNLTEELKAYHCGPQPQESKPHQEGK